MKTSEVLNKAADAIEREGWHQGSYSRDGGWSRGPFCALVPAAWFRAPIHLTSTGALMHHVGGRVTVWNDAPERTATEVIEVLRACAVIQAAREDQDAAEATYADNLATVSA